MHRSLPARPICVLPPTPPSQCVDERAAPPTPWPGSPTGPPPLQLLCTSFNHCGWSNNAAMFRKRFWLKVYSSGASLTHDGNGMFEVSLCSRTGLAAVRAERQALAQTRTWTPSLTPLRPFAPIQLPCVQINAMVAGCQAQQRLGSSDRTWLTPGDRPPFFCQLWPGPNVHEVSVCSPCRARVPAAACALSSQPHLTPFLFFCRSWMGRVGWMVACKLSNVFSCLAARSVHSGAACTGGAPGSVAHGIREASSSRGSEVARSSGDSLHASHIPGGRGGPPPPPCGCGCCLSSRPYSAAPSQPSSAKSSWAASA